MLVPPQSGTGRKLQGSVIPTAVRRHNRLLLIGVLLMGMGVSCQS